MHLVQRDLTKLQTVLERTPLGDGLVTTPAQTLYDLLAKPETGDAKFAIDEAVTNLRAQVGLPDLEKVAEEAKRVPAAVRAMLSDRHPDPIRG